MYKISWVYDNIDGPTNGVIDYMTNDKVEKLWFNKINNNEFYLTKISEKLMEELFDEHIQHCKNNRTSIFHGIPFEYERIANKSEEINTIDETKQRVLCKVTKQERKLMPEEIRGKHVMTINKSDITNYNVPHMIQIKR